MQSASLDVDASACVPALPTLRDQDAWEIAMTWQPQLQGKVRLVLERDEPIDSIIQRYAWVRLDDPRPLVEGQPDDVSRHQVTSIKRAVMLTWHALASCPGNSGTENGAFWKRVLSVLQEKPQFSSRPYMYHPCFFSSHDEPASVTDAHGFFDRPGHTFPRFMVPSPEQSDQGLTLNDSALAPEVKDRLDSLLARLKPYRRAVAPPRAIDVCLCVREFFTENEVRAVAALVDTINRPCIVRDPRDPVFDIREIRFRRSIQLRSHTQVSNLLRLVRSVDVPIGHINVSLVHDESPRSRAEWLRAFLRLDGHGVQACVESCGFPRDFVSDTVFQALMSALPFAMSVRSLAFVAQQREGAFEQIDLPWLAYAIFHPRTASSSWHHLAMERITLTPYSTHVLAAMARGNNLLALLRDTPPRSNAYYSARLVAGTKVQWEPRTMSDVLCVVPSTDLTVDLCGISSLDRVTWGEWVAVIVRAYGLGWVRGGDLYDECAHAPSTHGLSGLRLHKLRNAQDAAEAASSSVLLHFLPPLGHMLTYLDIDSSHNTASTTLDAILRVCPSLKTLIVGHAGQLWSAPLHDTTVPLETRLEELELSVLFYYPCIEKPTLDHIATSFRNLRALRVRVCDYENDQLLASRSTLEQLLEHATTLRYVHWHNGADDALVPYTDSQVWTPTALATLDLNDTKYHFAQGSLNASCAAAFLSVIAWPWEIVDRSKALDRLVDRGVLLNIFEFATSPRGLSTSSFQCSSSARL